jgi:hyperosmotically inducible periplasmic protein
MRNLSLILVAGLVVAACSRPSAELDAATSTASAPPPGQATPPTQVSAAKPARIPAPEALTDGAITSRIHTAIVGDPAMTGADVSVNTDKGVVVLSGTVKSHEQGGIASAHAQRQDGVMRVDNHLRPAFS